MYSAHNLTFDHPRLSSEVDRSVPRRSYLYSMIRVVPLLGVFLFAGWTLSFNKVSLSYFKVDRENNDMVVTWESTTEEGVARYELQRRTRFSNNQFVVVAEASPHGTQTPYRIMDDQVYKMSSEQVDYRLEAVYENGIREELASQSVSYTPTTVRRTWGSIKAMFQ